MSDSIIYRHNIMSINSIDTFLSIKGGFNKELRDVYFVRAVGCMPNLDTKIVEIDKRMDKEALNKRLSYKRIKALPRIQNPDEMQFYSQQYDEWKSKRTLSLKCNKENLFAKTLGNAINTILSDYRKIKAGVTESIEKNLVVKMLFWVDKVIDDVLVDWNERKCIKVIAENVVKDQDYLFYYMLTLIGCDVLLIQYGSDIEIIDELKNKSFSFKIGDFNNINLPEYVKSQIEDTKAAEKQSEDASAHVAAGTVDIASLARRNNGESARETGEANRVIISRAAIERHQEENLAKRTVVNTNSDKPKQDTEKDFEELALLASSVVMITVFNRRGQPEATGSGIMIGKDGYILTNNHVVEDGWFYGVQIEDDDNLYKADGVIKTNNMLDMAIIRINKRLNPIPIYNGKKKLVRGQKVVAIGSPLGLFNSVSNGIISGFRTINDVDMIQFTAPISHGSSGGAVLNMQGQIIGISTAGIDKGQNINLAVNYENILIFARGFY